jgi:hypothetical protein
VDRFRSRSRGLPRRAALIASGAACLFLAAPVQAQQPGDATVTLEGTVVDAVAGGGVGGAFLSLGERGPRAIADSLGAFRIRGVPTGPHRLTVQRFGYVDLTLDLTVTDPPEPLELRMRIDPVAIEGLTVTGGARVALTGSVHDESTGDALPWASVRLSRDAVREEARAAADERGVFRTREVPTGAYLLLVERLGYESVYVPVDVGAPPLPIEVRLRPDSALLEGIAAFDAKRRTRRNATPFVVRAFGETELRFSRAAGMRQFLQQYTFLFPCSGRVGELCFSGRRGEVAVSVVIDELVAYGGMDQLDSYSPEELYSIELFRCASTMNVRAYSYAFIERMGRRPRLMFPPCGF